MESNKAVVAKLISILGFAFAVIGIIFLLRKNYILSENPFAIIIQLAAVALMVWARITFGSRSFHAAANTTKGELVTHGPYRYFRHPIYASIIYFSLASFIAYPKADVACAVVLIILGLFIRMFLEEKFLLKTYTDYAAYAAKTKRVIPGIL